MTAVYCFSGSGHSRAVADFFAGQLGCRVTGICAGMTVPEAETALVVFPVYCQNIPAPVKTLLCALRAEYVVLIATYGRISYGNVLWEAAQLVRGQVIAGACVPMGHTYLSADKTFDKEALLPILRRIESPQRAQIPREHKDLLADLFPAWRSRVGVKLIRTADCRGCGVCSRSCPVQAIQNGRAGSRCIRCLRCVTVCPHKALQFQNSWVLQKYLDSHCKDTLVLYL